MLPLSEFSNKSPEETGKSFEENAIIKAKNAGKIINWKFPCLADDSGLCIEILGNKPGINSSNWAEEYGYEKVFEIINKKIRNVGNRMEGQPAFFYCSLAFLKSPSNVKLFNGKLKGYLTYPPKGDLGFGYDPIFKPIKENKTLAQLGELKKNKISHRKEAINKLVEYILEK